MQGQGSGGGISAAEEGIKEEPVSEEEVSNLKTFRQSDLETFNFFVKKPVSEEEVSNLKI